jgi:hypothetical protein
MHAIGSQRSFDWRAFEGPIREGTPAGGCRAGTHEINSNRLTRSDNTTFVSRPSPTIVNISSQDDRIIGVVFSNFANRRSLNCKSAEVISVPRLRLAADKDGGEMNVLPKNFRPAITVQKHTQQGMPYSVPTADMKQTAEDRRIEKSETKTKISICTNSQCNVFRMDQQKGFMDLTTSFGLSPYLMHDTMMANSSMMIQEEQQAIQDNTAPSFLNELLDFHSQSCTLAERRCEQHSLDFFDREIKSLDLCKGCDDSRYIMYGRFEESCDGCLVDDSSQSSVCSLDYGHDVFQL